MHTAFIALCFVALAFGAVADDKKKDDAGIIGFLAAPEFAAATAALQAVKDLVSTSKSSEIKIGERQAGTGFQSLHIQASASQTTYIRKEPMIDHLAGFINRLTILPQLKDEGVELLRRIADVYDGAGQEISFSFSSPTTGGEIAIAFFTMGPVRIDGDRMWRCSTFRASGSFKVMPDWFIKSTSTNKKGFLKSSSTSTQEIVYVDRGVTQEDVAQLFLVVIPDLSAVKTMFMTNDNMITDGQ